jgi:hypothetical protein
LEVPAVRPWRLYGYRLSITTTAVFENTITPLRDWFKIAHLMLTSKRGMSVGNCIAT